jgi:hypothetical protein
VDLKTALTILEDTGVLEFGPTRSGAYVAELPKSTQVIATDATVGGRTTNEHDRIGLLGLLLTAASERGLTPATLLAVGLAQTLLDTADSDRSGSA